MALAIDVISGGVGEASHFSVGETTAVAFWRAGQASALDAESVSEGRDVGSVAVYVPRVNGRELTFQHDGSNFVDAETESVWLLTGEAVEGQLIGEKLQQLPHRDTFWFAWSTYQPDTKLITE